MARIGVYGATGYTGRLVARELLDRGHEVLLCGRDAERLRAASEGLGGTGAGTAPAGVDDPAALRRAFADLDALVNCAGPFVRHGAPVLEAAIATGTHYVDTTGEQPWMHRVFTAFDAPAREADVAVVPAMGFDYVPGDLLGALVGRPAQPLRELVLAYALAGFGATRGTMRSALEMLGADEVLWRDGALRPAGRFGPLRTRFDFGAPIGRVAMAGYPSGEAITVPHHLDVRTVRTLITASTFAPGPLAPAVGVLAPVAGLALRTPLKGLLDRAIGRLPEGPPEDARRGARYTIACLACGEDGSVRRGVLRGTDVYGITGFIAALGAERLAGGVQHTGALAPGVAFDPAAFLEELRPRGISVELDRAPEGAAA